MAKFVMATDSNTEISAGSCDDLLHDFAGHIGQAERAAVVLEGEAFVIETHQVEHRGVQVVDVDLAFDAVVAEVVGRRRA